jgi:hypothetical protein
MLHAVMVRYERLLVAVTAERNAPALAVEYVSEMRPCYEWEGYHDCPEHEALFAMEYLAGNRTRAVRSRSTCHFLPLIAGSVLPKGMTTRSARRTRLVAGARPTPRFKRRGDRPL